MFSAHEVFDLAIQIEENGERFYREAMARRRSRHPGTPPISCRRGSESPGNLPSHEEGGEPPGRGPLDRPNFGGPAPEFYRRPGLFPRGNRFKRSIRCKSPPGNRRGFRKRTPLPSTKSFCPFPCPRRRRRSLGPSLPKNIVMSLSWKRRGGGWSRRTRSRHPEDLLPGGSDQHAAGSVGVSHRMGEEQ